MNSWERIKRMYEHKEADNWQEVLMAPVMLVTLVDEASW